jgi:creatinine amidohydrolase
MSPRRLSDCAWPDLTGQRMVLAIPLGATEQHGPHLPLSTDTDVAVELCEHLASARADVVVAPALSYGSSGEHAGFPGTLSIGREALELLVVELVRSAAGSFDGVVLVSGHGGNADSLRGAVATLRDEGRDVLLFQPRVEGDAHAGRTETAMMLALRPAAVRRSSAAAGNVRPLRELMPALRREGVRSVSANGVLGDPSGATAEEGRALLGVLAGQLLEEVAQWRR